MDNVVTVALANTVNEAFLGVLKSKSDYDFYRGIIWANAATLVDAVTNYRDQGTLDSSILQEYVDALTTILDRFNTVTNDTAQRVDSSWMNPRFHDYYDFLNNILNGWRNELNVVPPAVVTPIITLPPVPNTAVAPTGGTNPVLGFTVDTSSDFSGGSASDFPTNDAINQGINVAIGDVRQIQAQGVTDKNYDAYRAKVWAAFASLVDAVTIYRKNGQLDRPGLQLYINAVDVLVTNFKTYSEQLMAASNSSFANWVRPRFHDYYDFMLNMLNNWRNELLTLPVGSIFGGSVTPPPTNTPSPTGSPIPGTSNVLTSIGNTFSQNPMLLLGVGVLAFFALRRK